MFLDSCHTVPFFLNKRILVVVSPDQRPERVRRRNDAASHRVPTMSACQAVAKANPRRDLAPAISRAKCHGETPSSRILSERICISSAPIAPVVKDCEDYSGCTPSPSFQVRPEISGVMQQDRWCTETCSPPLVRAEYHSETPNHQIFSGRIFTFSAPVAEEVTIVTIIAILRPPQAWTDGIIGLVLGNQCSLPYVPPEYQAERPQFSELSPKTCTFVAVVAPGVRIMSTEAATRPAGPRERSGSRFAPGGLGSHDCGGSPRQPRHRIVRGGVEAPVHP